MESILANLGISGLLVEVRRIVAIFTQSAQTLQPNPSLGRPPPVNNSTELLLLLLLLLGES
jgi:hypothetical protein